MSQRVWTHSFEQNLPIEEAVNKLREVSKKKPRQIRGYHLPPYKIYVTRIDDERYTFELMLGPEFWRFGLRSLVEVYAHGLLSKIDDFNTSIAFECKVLWALPLILYGATILSFLLVTLLKGFLIFMVVIPFLLITWASVEISHANEYLEELPQVLTLLLASPPQARRSPAVT